MKPKRRKVLVGLVVVLLVAGVTFWATRDFVLHKIGTVRDGVLYRSAELGPRKLASVIGDKNIRTVVNLCEVPDEEEARVARENGARYVWLPSTQVPKPENIQAILDLLDHPDNLPILVHCEHGVGRTGVVSGLYRLEYEGWEIEDVLEEARFYAFGGSYWEGQDKTDFLREYVPRHERGSDPASEAPVDDVE